MILVGHKFVFTLKELKQMDLFFLVLKKELLWVSIQSSLLLSNILGAGLLLIGKEYLGCHTQ
jgi:hypothetical protein